MASERMCFCSYTITNIVNLSLISNQFHHAQRSCYFPTSQLNSFVIDYLKAV